MCPSGPSANRVINKPHLAMNANYNLMSGKQDANIFLKMTNLLDEDGRMHTSFIKDRAPIMGRSVILGFQVTF